jgi:hypothetical protein
MHRIDSSMLHRWIKMEQRLISAPSKKTRKIGSVRTVEHPLQEQHLFERFESDRSIGLAVSCVDLRNQMLEFIAPINHLKYGIDVSWDLICVEGIEKTGNVNAHMTI